MKMKTIKSNNFPRANNIPFMVPAEKAIYEAIGLIEYLGADVRLTTAQMKLNEAKQLVSEYVDEMLTD
jgi:hypothetical protein